MSADASKPIRIVVALGSVRPGNMSAKAARLVIDELEKDPAVAVDVIDPADLRLSLPGLSSDQTVPAKLKALVSSATGLVLVTPEYHGSYSSVMKLVIEQLGYPSAMSGKPVALLGVAAGAIGAIKALEHLHSVCSHVGAIALPGPASIASVHELFDEDGNCTDAGTERRIRRVSANLLDYIRQNICPRVAMEQMVREPGSS